jgi:hypothetical protein
MDTSEAGKAETDVKAEEGTNGTGKVRSETSYPFYGLAKVTEIVKAVQRAGGNAAAPTADVLKELNITKTTERTWAYGIPAAVLFGVVERIGRGDDAKIKLTALGLRIALPGTPSEERATKVAAFKNPELYSKLLETFAGHPAPSKEVLKNILQRDYKIVESMAGNAADAFLESLKVAELINPAGNITLAAGAGEEAPKIEEKKEKKAPSNDTQTIEVPADFIVYRCKISGGRVIEIPLPPKFSQADVARLNAFLQTQIDEDPMETKL